MKEKPRKHTFQISQRERSTSEEHKNTKEKFVAKHVWLMRKRASLLQMSFQKSTMFT